ncbi:MAG: 5'-nucleotidase [Bacteroidetes bacterium]|jgi:2',3'-cyclic-nucleotide 2'-phosphodiesterase (5'-nucleotidase family)|nr:5'-nucleotidase [Bacteroidota bacterium]
MNFRKIFPALFFSAAFFMVACHHGANVTGVEVQYVEMNKNASQFDSATDYILHPYKDSLDKIMNVKIGFADVAMPKESGKTETLLGNFVADLCLEIVNHPTKPTTNALKADICLFNNGGMRSSLPKGDITRKNVFELMPFDNELNLVTISGKQMWNLLRFVSMSGGEPLSGMKIGVKPDKTPGQTIIQGQVFDSTKTYTVLTSDYLANGGDRMDFLKNPIKLTTTGIKIRDAILQYCEEQTAQGKTLTATLDERFYYETK